MVRRARHIAYGYIIAIVAVMCLTFMTGCFTGVESTSKVKLSRDDKKTVAPTAEELLSANFMPDSLKVWAVGRKFRVTDKQRAALVIRPVGSRPDSIGEVLTYTGSVERIAPGGGQHVWLQFSDGSGEWEYDTGKTRASALASVTSLDVPMLIDMQYVAKIEKMLRGEKLYVRTSEWYDRDGRRFHGRKFAEVKVDSVAAGNVRFPFRVAVTSSDGQSGFLYMSSGRRGTDSRTFQNLFSITDPREKYKNIAPEIWENIQTGKVQAGMTKEECRLALGSPSGVNEGRDYTKLIDIWSYGDGKYLRFEDGLLVDFRL